MNETTELIMKQLNQKKTHAVTHEVGGGDEIDATRLKNITNYLETDGDFTGTWNGYEMTSVDAGLSAQFDVLKEGKSRISVTCYELQMVANDESEGDGNLVKFTDALQNGYTVFFDDDYYLSGTSADTIADVRIEGYGSLVIGDKDFCLNVSNSVHVQNVNIFVAASVTDRDEEKSVFLGTGEHMTSVFVENVKCSTHVCVFKFIKAAAPAVLLDSLTIRNCEFIYSYLTFYLKNVNLESLTVDGNSLRNIETVPFNFNTVDCPKVIISNNTVKNDIDYWKDSVTEYYSMMILTGNGDAYYRGNKVIGLKVNLDGVAVYDAYLSYTRVYWIENLWQDNISVNASAPLNYLFYGKTALADDGTSYREVSRNRYLITSALIAILSPAEIATIQIGVFKFQDPIDTFIFSDNYVDTQTLKLNGNGGDQIYRVFVYKNNHIEGNLTTDLIRGYSDSTNSEMVISGNYIRSTGTSTIVFMFSSGGSSVGKKFGNIVIENNHLEFAYTNFISQFSAVTMHLNNNVIVNTTTAVNGSNTFIASLIDNVIGTNNAITSFTGVSDFVTTTYTKLDIEFIKSSSNLISNKTAVCKLFVGTQGGITVEDMQPTPPLGAKQYNFYFKLTDAGGGLTNIQYPVDGVDTTTTLNASKFPFVANTNILFATSPELRFIFSTGKTYRFSIKYLIIPN